MELTISSTYEAKEKSKYTLATSRNNCVVNQILPATFTTLAFPPISCTKRACSATHEEKGIAIVYSVHIAKTFTGDVILYIL